MYGSDDDRTSSSNHGDTGYDDANVPICGEHWPHGGWSARSSNQVGWLRHYNEISDRVMTGTLLQLGRQTGHPLPGGGVPVAVLQEISPHQGRHPHSQVWGLDQLPSSLSLLCYRHAHEGRGE